MNYITPEAFASDDLYGVMVTVNMDNPTEALILAEGVGPRTFLGRAVSDLSKKAFRANVWPISIPIPASQLQDIAAKLTGSGLLPADLEAQLVADDLIE